MAPPTVAVPGLVEVKLTVWLPLPTLTAWVTWAAAL